MKTLVSWGVLNNVPELATSPNTNSSKNKTEHSLKNDTQNEINENSKNPVEICEPYSISNTTTKIKYDK